MRLSPPFPWLGGRWKIAPGTAALMPPQDQ